jgi:Flp pilus assembly protein TadG
MTSPTSPPTTIPATRAPHPSPAIPSSAPWRVDRGERGGAPAVEAALLAVLLAAVIAFVMAGGRLVAAESAADQAARSAARIASIARDPATARRHAHDVAHSTLAAQHLTCTQLQVTVDTAGFATTLEQTGLVRATVACAVRWSDLALPGAPGTRTVTATFTSPIDRFRERAA